MSALDGGKFGAGALSGAVSSLVSSGIQVLGETGKAVSETGKYSTFASRNPTLLKALMVVSGGLSGGISSTIAGGNFWDGFRHNYKWVEPCGAYDWWS